MHTDPNNPPLWSLRAPHARRSRARTLLMILLLMIGLIVVFCGEVAAAEAVTLEASYSVRDMFYAIGAAVGSILVLFLGTMRFLAAKVVELYDQANGKRFDGLQEKLSSITAAQNLNADRIAQVDRDVLQLRAELNKDFVRREEYIRTEFAFHARLDRLSQIIQDFLTKVGTKNAS